MQTDEPAMRRFPVPEFDSLPADIRNRIEDETDEAGFTPNVFAAFAYRPSHFRAFFAYYDALIENTELTREEIEMIVVVTSAANDCYYCNVAHGALVRLYSSDHLLADQLVANYRLADVSDRQMAMLDFAVKLTEQPGTVTDDDLDALEEAGFSQRAIWDIGSVVSFFNLSNRMAHLADMRPNEAFHVIGYDEV